MTCGNCYRAAREPRWPGYSRECAACFQRALSKCTPEDARGVLANGKPKEEKTT